MVAGLSSSAFGLVRADDANSDGRDQESHQTNFGATSIFRFGAMEVVRSFAVLCTEGSTLRSTAAVSPQLLHAFDFLRAALSSEACDDQSGHESARPNSLAPGLISFRSSNTSDHINLSATNLPAHTISAISRLWVVTSSKVPGAAA